MRMMIVSTPGTDIWDQYRAIGQIWWLIEVEFEDNKRCIMEN